MNQDITLKEKVQHGTKRNPIMGLHFTAGKGTGYPEKFFVERHWHDSIEILYIIRGSYQIEINLQNEVLQEGDICILNSGDLHQITGESAEAIHEVVLFDPAILDFSYHDEMQEECVRPLIEQLRLFPHIFRKGEECGQCILPVVEKLMKIAVEKKEGWYLKSKLLIMELVVEIYEKGWMLLSDSVLSKSEERRIKQYKTVVSYMEENYQNPISLQDMADTISCNSQYLCRFFREIAGTSPIQYLINLRLEKACYLLQHSSKSVLEIALDCGFENVSYFIRKFKEVKGCTPKQYCRGEMG